MMTSRERWLAAIQMKPVDRLPFWPKLSGSYTPAQQAPFHDMSIDEVHQWIGSDRHVHVVGCLREVRSKTSARSDREGDIKTTVYDTPGGLMRAVSQYDDRSRSWHPREFPVKTRDDIRRMSDYFDDARVELDDEALARANEQVAEIGEDAVQVTGIGTSAMMNWVEHIAGVEQAHLLLMEYPEEVAVLFEAYHRVLRRRTELMCEHHPADLLYLTENTSTSLISPDQYRTLNYPHVLECAQIAVDHGRLMVLHMCGLLKRLLPDLATLPVRAFEAFTSPSLADTTLLDGRGACPETCLVGGTNAYLWTRPVERIIEQVEEDLDALPHHRGIVVTSAGVMPPLASPEKIKAVCDWVKEYEARA